MNKFGELIEDWLKSNKRAEPRTIVAIDEQIYLTISDAILAWHGEGNLNKTEKDRMSTDQIQKWFKEKIVESGAAKASFANLRTETIREAEQLRIFVNGFDIYAKADRDGYWRQWFFRIGTTAGVAITFIGIWFIASWIAAKYGLQMPGIRLINPKMGG